MKINSIQAISRKHFEINQNKSNYNPSFKGVWGNRYEKMQFEPGHQISDESDSSSYNTGNRYNLETSIDYYAFADENWQESKENQRKNFPHKINEKKLSVTKKEYATAVSKLADAYKKIKSNEVNEELGKMKRVNPNLSEQTIKLYKEFKAGKLNSEISDMYKYPYDSFTK